MSKILLVLRANVLEMSGERVLHSGRQYRDPILVAHATPHDDLNRREIDVLDPQPAAFEYPTRNPEP